jgi:hypothetical protein
MAKLLELCVFKLRLRVARQHGGGRPQAARARALHEILEKHNGQHVADAARTAPKSEPIARQRRQRVSDIPLRGLLV